MCKTEFCVRLLSCVQDILWNFSIKQRASMLSNSCGLTPCRPSLLEGILFNNLLCKFFILFILICSFNDIRWTQWYNVPTTSAVCLAVLSLILLLLKTIWVNCSQRALPMKPIQNMEEKKKMFGKTKPWRIWSYRCDMECVNMALGDVRKPG